jgi:hypothetical protein
MNLPATGHHGYNRGVSEKLRFKINVGNWRQCCTMAPVGHFFHKPTTTKSAKQATECLCDTYKTKDSKNAIMI